MPQVAVEVRRQLVDHGDRLRGEAVGKLLAERPDGVGDEPDEHVQVLGLGAMEPRDVPERLVTPTGAVQQRQLVDGVGEVLQSQPAHLVALLGRRDVLQEDDVRAGGGVVGGVMARGGADRQVGRQVAVEAGLDLVGPRELGAGAAGLLRRGTLAITVGGPAPGGSHSRNSRTVSAT